MPVPVKNIKRVTISIEWDDQWGTTRKDFDNVNLLAEFLKDNPEIAKVVKYVKGASGTGQKT